MPVARFEMPDGRIGRFEVAEGTTPEQAQSQISELISQQGAQDVTQRTVSDIPSDTVGQPSDQLAAPAAEEPSLFGVTATDIATLSGIPELTPEIAEPAATLATGTVAEPIAGIAGIAQTINPFADPKAGARAVEATREALTFQPRTEAGQAGLEAVGEAVEPVAKVLTEAEEFLGDNTLKATGSPALAAAAKTIPTALGEVLGVAAGKGIIIANKAAKKLAEQGKIARAIEEAAPTIDQLKDASRAVYKEIDDLGATMQPKAFEGLANKLNIVTRKAGADPDITPKSTKALARFNELVGGEVTLTEVDTLRKVAQNAAKSLEPAESAIGTAMVDNIDQFLDQLGPKAFKRDVGPVTEIGKRYKVARKLWGQARRSELIQDAFEKARNQASGFENGIRTQFRSILNSKKQRRFFNEGEIKAIERVVRGTGKENLAKLIGKLGFTEGGATGLIGGAVGVTAGAASGIPGGAVIVPVIGQVSKKLAQRMTAKNAEFADQVIRAGKNAEDIAEAYIKNTPKANRSSAELSELLMQPDIDLTNLPDKRLIQEAAAKAQANRAALAGALTAGQEQQ